ncbi:MAG: transglutaminase-like domain-containing protein, partial [Muribaculaceae bacterium]|nr:transglutaminase-like domain-containing protein [Muribaculaceae bacterium]
RGNHPVVTAFLASLTPEQRVVGLDLLEAMSEKDRRDITMENLIDHVATAPVNSPMFKYYILCPRVANEALTPYKSQFSKVFSSDELKTFAANPRKLVERIGKEIALEEVWNPLNLRMTPIEAWNHKKTDDVSRSILFVAIARTAGIPARIDPVTGKTQWAGDDNKWNDVVFEAVAENNTPQGDVKISFTPVGRISNPNYYNHFSLSKISDGTPWQMAYPEDGTYESIFGDGERLDEGQYMLTSGQRMANGGVLARSVIFTVKPDETADVDLVMRRDTAGVQVIGSFNSENRYFDLKSKTEKSLLSTAGRGYYILTMLKPNHEPSVHALNDLSARKAELEATGRTIFLMFPDRESADKFDASVYPNLPSNVVFGVDTTGVIAAELPEKEMPVVIIGDTFNRVVFISSGYTISLGDQLVDTMHKIVE